MSRQLHHPVPRTLGSDLLSPERGGSLLVGGNSWYQHPKPTTMHHHWSRLLSIGGNFKCATQATQVTNICHKDVLTINIEFFSEHWPSQTISHNSHLVHKFRA